MFQLFLQLLDAGDGTFLAVPPFLQAGGFAQGRAQDFQRPAFDPANDADDLGTAHIQRRHQAGAPGRNLVVDPEAERFAAFILSPEGQRILASFGFDPGEAR